MEDVEFEAMRARLVAKARDFGQKYFMLPNGELVLREDYERWLTQDREIARRQEENRREREAARLCPPPRRKFILLITALLVGLGVWFFI